jgi:hypothetical protein
VETAIARKTETTRSNPPTHLASTLGHAPDKGPQLTRRDSLGSPTRPSEVLIAEAAGDGMIRSTPHPRSPARVLRPAQALMIFPPHRQNRVECAPRTDPTSWAAARSVSPQRLPRPVPRAFPSPTPGNNSNRLPRLRGKTPAPSGIFLRQPFLSTHAKA